MTGPGKTGLIYTKYTCLYYGTYLLFCMCYTKSGNCIEFLMDFCICDDVLHMIQITDKKLLHFKLSKLGQNLRVDKTCFPRPSHIYFYKLIEKEETKVRLVCNYLHHSITLTCMCIHMHPIYIYELCIHELYTNIFAHMQFHLKYSCGQ